MKNIIRFNLILVLALIILSGCEEEATKPPDIDTAALQLVTPTESTLTINATSIVEIVDFTAIVKNISGSDVNVKCKIEVIEQTDGHTLSPCWVDCLDKLVDSFAFEGVITLQSDSQTVETDAICKLAPNGTIGSSSYKITFFNEADETDFVEYTVTVNVIDVTEANFSIVFPEESPSFHSNMIGPSNIEVHMDIMNETSSDLTLGCRMVFESLVPGHEIAPCWGESCYLPQIENFSFAETLNIPANETIKSFIGYFDTDGSTGTSIMRVVVWDIKKPFIRAEHVFNFNIM